ncbi:MAG: alpha/beta hydrolase [Actinomycetota bacterium]
MSTISETRAQQVMPQPTSKVRVSHKDELDVWVMGEGEPVVFVHGAMARDLLTPLINELAKTGRYQTIHYGRRGHGGRGLPGESADIAGQACDVVAILDSLGIDKAHVGGHSFGGYIALELATRVPDRLLSAILLEPLLGQHLRTEPALETMKEAEVAIPRIVENYVSGDQNAAVTMLWDFTSGIEGGTELIEPALPKGARELAATDLNTFIQVDLPAMGSWIADPATMKEISTPVAWIGGAESPPAFAESCAILLEWLPTMKAATIDGASHYFPTLKPAETATTIDKLLRSQGPANQV